MYAIAITRLKTVTEITCHKLIYSLLLITMVSTVHMHVLRVVQLLPLQFVILKREYAKNINAFPLPLYNLLCINKLKSWVHKYNITSGTIKIHYQLNISPFTSIVNFRPNADLEQV